MNKIIGIGLGATAGGIIGYAVHTSMIPSQVECNYDNQLDCETAGCAWVDNQCVPPPIPWVFGSPWVIGGLAVGALVGAYFS